jgi:MFS family permease
VSEARGKTAMFASLRVRNYRLYAGGQVVSSTGTWMQRIAQDLLILQLTGSGSTLATGSGTALGVTTALQFLPILLFSLYGGVIADRFPKRRLLIVTQSWMAAVGLTLGILDIGGFATVWQVYLLAFALGLGKAIDSPTRQAFVSEMVEPAQLTNAVSLNSATFNLARVTGPAIAGFLVAAIGTGPVFFINAASFLAVIGALAAMRESELHTGKPVRRARGQLREGLAYVRARPALLATVVIAGVVGTLGMNFQLTTALVATHVFHRGATGYGLLSTALAVGSLIGALLAARRTRTRLRFVVGAAAAFGAVEVATALMPTYLAVALLLVPTGAAVLTFTTAAKVTMQLGSDRSMRGRVMALYLLVFAGGTPFGAPLIGWLADVIGPRSSWYIGGAASLLAALLVGLVLLRTRNLTVQADLRRRPRLRLRPAGESDEQWPSPPRAWTGDVDRPPVGELSGRR